MNSRILILTGSSGHGHIRAGENILQSLNIVNNSLTCNAINIFDHLPLVTKFVLEDLWEFASMQLPTMYSYSHKILMQNHSIRKMARCYFSHISKYVMQVIADYNPGIYIATHPASALIGASLKKHFQYKLCVSATDYVFHNYQYYEEVDYFYLPPSFSNLINVPTIYSNHNKVITTGIPLSPRFWERPNKVSNTPVSSGDRMTILFSFGGKGLCAEKHIRLLKEIFELSCPINLIIACGCNSSFKQKIDSIARSSKNRQYIKVLGYIDDLSEVMTSCDVFIGKAGGLTVSEALASNLAIGIIDNLPGQEEYNKKFIINNGLGIEINNGKMLAKWIETLCYGDTLHKYQKNIKNFARPLSALTIANHLSSLQQA